MKRQMTVWLVLLAFLIGSFLPGLQGQASAAPAASGTKKAVLVLVDGLRLADLSPQATPNLWRLHEIGALGVMNHNVMGTKTDGSAALTIGTGTRAAYPMQSAAAYSVLEQVKEGERTATGGDLYLRNLGTPAPSASIVVPQLPQIQEANAGTRYTIVPGLLGDAVHDLGGKTALLGNADLGTEAYRPAALIAMDHNGLIDTGDLQAGLRSDPARPYGLRTDLKAMYESYQKISQHAQLVVLETGDLMRWEKARDVMTLEQADRSYRQALGEADQLIGLLLPEAGPSTLLAVLSPAKHPGTEEVALSPVLMAGGNLTAGGLLTSSTTKRQGLVANYDIAPTLVQFLGGDPGAYPFLGQPAASESGSMPDSYQEVKEQVKAMTIINAARPMLLKPWLNAWIGLAALLLVAQLFRRRSWLNVLRPVSEAMMIVPLTWLFVPIYKPASALQVLVFTVCITMTLWLFFQGFRNPVTRLGSLAAVTTAALVLDLLLGAPLEKQSILSYDPIAGARYYGIGNEYMGILLGSLLLLLNAWFSDRARSGAKSRLSAVLLCVLVLYLFAAPAFGTNAGGALAAAIGFAYGCLQIANLKMTAKSWLGIAFIAGGILLIMVGLNVLLPGTEQTHIGRAASQLLGGQYGEVAQIAMRKVQLNFLLLRVSAWGKLLVLLLVLYLLLTLRQSPAKTGFLSRNGKTLLVTAIAALLLNDSGVVSAALTLLYAVVPMIGSDASMETSLPAEADETPTHTQ